MKPALILLAVLVVTGALLWLIERLMPRRQAAADDAPEPAEAPQPTPSSGCADTSCALRSVCPSEQLLAGQCASGATYYEDEELDAYRGRTADGYTADEEEQWRDVLYTLQPTDLLGWGQSVRQRGLVMPACIHEEFLQLVTEQRGTAGQ